MAQLAAIVISAAAPADTPIWTPVEAIGAGMTGVFAFFAFLVAIRQLYQARQMAAERLAHNYLRRYDEPWRLPFVEKAHVVIGSTAPKDVNDVAARLDTWKEMLLKDQFEVLTVLNFWEELGGMYNRKLVDQPLIDEYFGDSALNLWERAVWLAIHMRSQSPGDSIYNEWEDMCLDIRVKRATRRPRTVDPVCSHGHPISAPPDSPAAQARRSA